MKYPKTLLPVLLLLATLSITSCSKSAKEEPSSLSGKLKLIRRLATGNESKTEYQYDNKGFLISVRNTNADGNSGSFNELRNDGNGMPILSIVYTTKTGEDPKKQMTVNYTYKDNRLVEYKEIAADGTFSSIQKYIYNNQNFLESSIITQNVDSSNPYIYQTYDYTVDSKGVVITQTGKTYLSGPTIPSISTIIVKYEYDNKVSPLPAHLTAVYRPHNTTKMTIKNDGSSTEIVRTFAFDYNANGLPVKEYLVESGGNKLIAVYEYY